MKPIAIVLAVVALSAALLAADEKRLKDAEFVLSEMAAAGDKGIPASLLAKAKCVVIVPGLLKGAFVFGGQYGRGYLSCRRDGGWSAPGAIRIEGGSVGFQIGGSATDVIMAVMNDKGVDRLLSNQFKMGADAAVAAGPIGREATAQTDATMRAEMLAWSRSRGVFAGIALQGSTLRQDAGANKELYGREITNREIVSGKVAAPAAARGFMNALSKY